MASAKQSAAERRAWQPDWGRREGTALYRTAQGRGMKGSFTRKRCQSNRRPESETPLPFGSVGKVNDREETKCYPARMVYVLSFLSAAAAPLAVAGYVGHLTAKVLDRPERLRALTIVWVLAAVGVVLSGVQQILMYRSDRMHDQQQAAMVAKAEHDQQQLREKLDASLNHEDEVRKDLGRIVQYLRAPQPRMSTREIADAASKMVDDAMHR